MFELKFEKLFFDYPKGITKQRQIKLSWRPKREIENDFIDTNELLMMQQKEAPR